MTGESSGRFGIYTTVANVGVSEYRVILNCDLLYEFLSTSRSDIADQSNANDDETLAALP